MLNTAIMRVALISSIPRRGRPRSVQLHRAALDAIDTRRTRKQIGTFDQYLASPGQRDAGFAAAKDQLFLGVDQHALAVRINLDLCRFVFARPRGRAPEHTHHDRARRVPVLEYQDDTPADVRALEVDRGTRRYGSSTWRLCEVHQRCARVFVDQGEQLADDHAINARQRVCRPRRCAEQWREHLSIDFGRSGAHWHVVGVHVVSSPRRSRPTQFCRTLDPLIVTSLDALTLIFPDPSTVMSLPLMAIVPSFFIV